ASLATAMSSRATIVKRARPAIMARTAAVHPSQSDRAKRSRISRSIQRPSASDTSRPNAAIKIDPKRERLRFCGNGGGASSANASSSKTSISSGVTRICSSIGRARGWRNSSAVLLFFAPERGGLTGKAEGRRGSLMPVDLRAGTEARGPAEYGEARGLHLRPCAPAEAVENARTELPGGSQAFPRPYGRGQPAFPADRR